MKKILGIFLSILTLPAYTQLSVTNETGCPGDIMVNGQVVTFLQATNALGQPYSTTVNLSCSSSGFEFRYLENGLVKPPVSIRKKAGDCSVVLTKDGNGLVYNKLYSASAVTATSLSSSSSGSPAFMAYVGLINKSNKYAWIEKSTENGPFAGVCLKPMDTCRMMISLDGSGKPIFKIYKALWEQGYHQMSMRFSATADIRDAQPQSTLMRYVAQGDEFIIILNSDYPPEATLATGEAKEVTARFIINNNSSKKLVGETGSLKNVVFTSGMTFDRSMIAKTGKQDFAFSFIDNSGMARQVTMNAVLSRGRIIITITDKDLEGDFFHK